MMPCNSCGNKVEVSIMPGLYIFRSYYISGWLFYMCSFCRKAKYSEIQEAVFRDMPWKTVKIYIDYEEFIDKFVKGELI